MKQCRLCGKQCEHLAKSHIFSRGFFSKQPTKANSRSVSSSRQGRRLPAALYDPDIVCHECEHGIMQPLDDYAIKVIRDQKDAMHIQLRPDSPMTIVVFESVEKRKMRAFIASVLWRCSVSKQLEVRNISIGSVYEDRIREDLLHQGEFSYIDVVLFHLTDPRHGAFFVPFRKRLRPLDKNRDSQNINGWILQLPNISITVSLDKRPHPHSMFYNLDSSLTGQKENILASTSLGENANKFRFFSLETDVQDGHIESLLQLCKDEKLMQTNIIFR